MNSKWERQRRHHARNCFDNTFFFDLELCFVERPKQSERQSVDAKTQNYDYVSGSIGLCVGNYNQDH